MVKYFIETKGHFIVNVIDLTFRCDGQDRKSIYDLETLCHIFDNLKKMGSVNNKQNFYKIYIDKRKSCYFTLDDIVQIWKEEW